MPENEPTQPRNNKPDPTANVHFALESAITRIDDLDKLNTKLLDERFCFVTRKFEDVKERFKDVDTKYQIQFSAAKEALGIALVAQEKAVAAALEGTKEAINKADVATDKRFSLLSEKIDGVNEAINKNAGAQGVYVTHTDLSVEMEKLRTSFETMLRPVITFMNSQQGGAKSTNMVWVYIGIGIAALSGLVALVLNAIRLSGLGL